MFLKTACSPSSQESFYIFNVSPVSQNQVQNSSQIHCSQCVSETWETDSVWNFKDSNSKVSSVFLSFSSFIGLRKKKKVEAEGFPS